MRYGEVNRRVLMVVFYILKSVKLAPSLKTKGRKEILLTNERKVEVLDVHVLEEMKTNSSKLGFSFLSM